MPQFEEEIIMSILKPRTPVPESSQTLTGINKQAGAF